MFSAIKLGYFYQRGSKDSITEGEIGVLHAQAGPDELEVAVGGCSWRLQAQDMAQLVRTSKRKVESVEFLFSLTAV